MAVDAVQCAEAKTIATDLGFVNVKQGEWIVSGEGGERYVLDDAFFRRTFVPAEASSSVSQACDLGLKLLSSQPERDASQIPAQTRCHKDRIRLALRRMRSRRHTRGSRA
jgi:hypothetical protein